MMMRKMWTGWSIGMVAWLLLLAVSVRGDVKVTNIEVKPRYPWNGLVDIVYSINWNEVDLNGEPFEVRVEFEGYDTVLDKTFVMKSMSGDGVNAPITRDPDKTGGTYKATWNAAKDYPTINSSAFQVKIHASIPLYMVVDLSEGKSAEKYPVRYTGEAPDISKDTCRTTELWLRRIPAGKFIMGSPEDELGRNNDEVQHEVTITKPYYIAIFELTGYQALQIGSGYGSNSCVPFNNYVNITSIRNWSALYKENTTGCLGLLSRKTGLVFELPTEAEWEYACRAGTTTALNSGKNLIQKTGNDDNLNEVGNYSPRGSDGSNSLKKVGSYKPNAWGLYDMHGNAWEWCFDGYGEYENHAVNDPIKSDVGNYRVIRGGSLYCYPSSCRSASRNKADSGTSMYQNYGNYRYDWISVRVSCHPEF